MPQTNECSWLFMAMLIAASMLICLASVSLMFSSDSKFWSFSVLLKKFDYW